MGTENSDALLSTLHEIRPECDFQNSTDFISDGLLDSFDVVTIVSKIEKKFQISIPGDEVLPANFQNLETINALIRKHKP